MFLWRHVDQDDLVSLFPSRRLKSRGGDDDDDDVDDDDYDDEDEDLVDRMVCVPACGANDNSRNVSCSQSYLHREGAPSGRGAT